MTTGINAAAAALADIGHLLESVQTPEQQLRGAMLLLHRVVPYDRCALLDACSGPTPTVLTSSAYSPEQREEAQRRLAALHQLISEQPVPQAGPIAMPRLPEGLAHLAFPLIALDEAVGVLLVERTGARYEEHDLQLLAVVAAQLAGYLANVRLQSEERRASLAMQRAADLLEHIRDGFIELDRASVCVTANGAASDVLGVTHEQVLGSEVRALPELGERKSFLEACQRVLHQRTAEHVDAEHYPTRNRWLELELYPTELGVAVFLRDVSERHAAEEFRNVLTGIIGHDLRSPLGAITVGAATLLQRGALDGPAAQTVARIARSGARMSEMVEHLLDLTRMRFGQGLSIERREMDLARVCQDVVDELSAAHPHRRIGCDLTGDLRGGWDPARLAQVLTNLVGNAIQHGDQASDVRLDAHGASAGEVVIAVHNQGPAIAAADLSTIFQPFRQASRGVKTGGLGLGLYIAQSVVRAHGGTIEVTSSLEEGTTFTVRLPRR
jgi:PAS domain S-box-containing protein